MPVKTEGRLKLEKPPCTKWIKLLSVLYSTDYNKVMENVKSLWKTFKMLHLKYIRPKNQQRLDEN